LPAVWPSTRVVAPDAQYLSSPGEVGSKDWAYYPYHGIHISVHSTGDFALGLHVPPGTTAELNGDTVHVPATTKSGPVEKDLRISESHDFRALAPHEFTTVGEYHEWYLFHSQSGEAGLMPKEIVRGTIKLPSITINGQRYEPQVLPLERHVRAGVGFAYP
jgi:hypothetical protein